jgi:hypothetical protein
MILVLSTIIVTFPVAFFFGYRAGLSVSLYELPPKP